MSNHIVSRISIHQQHELLAALERAGLTSNLAQNVIQSRGNALARQIIDLIRGPLPDFPVYDFPVDYNLTVEELVDTGNCNLANNAINSLNFPSSERGKTQLILFLVNFALKTSSEEVTTWLAERGLRPATLKELLALCVAFPTLRLNNPVVALGSIWRRPDDYRDVPYLYYRRIDLGWWEGGWSPNYRFAAVRE